MKLTIWKNAKDIEKVLEIENFRVLYGTVQDILSLVDDIDSLDDSGLEAEARLIQMIYKNLPSINNMLKDAFSEFDLNDEELRRVDVKELFPLIIDLISYVKRYFGNPEKK